MRAVVRAPIGWTCDVSSHGQQSAIAIIAGVGFSRVYLGVHYPSVVIAGWALGVIGVSVLIAFVALLKELSAAADSTVRAGHPAASSDHD